MRGGPRCEAQLPLNHGVSLIMVLKDPDAKAARVSVLEISRTYYKSFLILGVVLSSIWVDDRHCFVSYIPVH